MGGPDHHDSLAPNLRAPIDATCPGCEQTVIVRTTCPINIEWDRLVDGRYIGWAICATKGIIFDFSMTVDGILEMGWEGGSEPGDDSLFGRQLGSLHECTGGGESNDRAARPPSPPARTSSIERDPHEST
jgi:hypothetical protein